VVEAKLNVLFGAGVTDPAGADVEVAVLFSPLVPSSFFCPNKPPKLGVVVFAVPKRPPVAPEEVVVGDGFEPKRPPAGALPVLAAPKSGAEVPELDVVFPPPNIEVVWLPPAVKPPKGLAPVVGVPPKRLVGALVVAVEAWPKGAEVLGEALPVFDAEPNGFEAPLPPAEPKLNCADIVSGGEWLYRRREEADGGREFEWGDGGFYLLRARRSKGVKPNQMRRIRRHV
jgi:hypothetical protein